MPRPPRAGLNRLEQRYALHLTARVQRGELATFWAQAIKVQLAHRTWYTPDFVVVRADGIMELHETKGFMRDDANVKLKVASELYWTFPVYLVRETRGVFVITPVAPHEEGSGT